MDLIGSAYNDLFRNLSLLFAQGYQGPEFFADKLAMRVTSSGPFNLYPWIASIPTVRKWVGPRVIQNMAAHRYLIENEDYEVTGRIPRNAIADDQIGFYNPVVQGYGYAAAKWEDDMVAAVLRNNAVGFDGVPLFSASHPTYAPSGAVYANDYALALNAVNFATVKTGAASLVNEGGKPLLVRYDTLVVPPQLEPAARTILNAEIIAANGGTGTVVAMSNIWRNSVKLVVIEDLADLPTTWWMMDTSRPVKPLILQVREPMTFSYKNAPTDDNVWWDKEIIFGADARGAAAPGLPFLMARSTG